MNTRDRFSLLLVLLLLAPTAALATNGMYLAGYGSEAGGRGGANIAVADRALGLQANPAGISQLWGNHFSVDFQFLMPDMDYQGAFGEIEAESSVFIMPSFSYVSGGKDTKWSWGIGLISQGGMGAHFKGYQTPFGTSDETFSQVRFLTLNPTVSYAFTENVSLGLSALLGYSDVEYRFWPDTSFYADPNNTPTDPSDDVAFPGQNLDTPASAFNYAFRLGLMWRVVPKVQLGFIYQSKTQGDYENGKLVVNQTGFPGGFGEVTFDATVDNFTWPAQYGAGIQWNPTKTWMFTLDVKRYLWSDAIELIQVTGTNPDSPSAFPTFEAPFTFLWKDRTVYAFGFEARATDSLTVRAGYNHGLSPVPDETLNPLFPAITVDHVTFGLGWTWKANTMNFALEHAFEASQTNNTTDPMINPFGPGSTVDHAQWTVSIGYSRAFSRNK